MMSDQVEVRNPVTALVLSFVTCGIYELFVWWPARLRSMNALLGREEFKYGTVLLMTIVTCGLMYVYYDYKISAAILDIKRERGTLSATSLPIIVVLLDLVGLGFVASLIHQDELNKLA